MYIHCGNFLAEIWGDLFTFSFKLFLLVDLSKLRADHWSKPQRGLSFPSCASSPPKLSLWSLPSFCPSLTSLGLPLSRTASVLTCSLSSLIVSQLLQRNGTGHVTGVKGRLASLLWLAIQCRNLRLSVDKTARAGFWLKAWMQNASSWESQPHRYHSTMVTHSPQAKRFTVSEAAPPLRGLVAVISASFPPSVPSHPLPLPLATFFSSLSK